MVNYHNHTSLCGHADGSLDEYVLAAVKNGVREFGFSDHAPLPEHLREGISMLPHEAEVYIGDVLGVKEKYKDRIDVKLGFEVDFPRFDTFDHSYLTDSRIDYIIGSVHFMGDWGFDNPEQFYRFEERPIDDIYRDFYKLVEGLVDSRFCDIIGHFDLIKKFGHRAEGDMSDIVRRIAKKISKNGTVAEINTSGLYKPIGEIYPSDSIMKIFFEENVPVTLGSDSHSPDDVGRGYDIAISKLKSTGYRKVSGFTGRVRHDVPLV
ncbi:MAG TPA: histidinol-phosphatase HisJ family protein [Spirochaetota bacterium]|nr:histidinol-phosphatase HisJ family protein [Spirochaetota bacterium]HPJ36604.1 histidinol-phosphatase HisJ family protein [Spirochaetota bacterium]